MVTLCCKDVSLNVGYMVFMQIHILCDHMVSLPVNTLYNDIVPLFIVDVVYNVSYLGYMSFFWKLFSKISRSFR